MTNKYLEKIAASLDKERDAAKTFAQSSAAGWVGHVGGAVAGSVGLGLLAAKNKRVGALAAKAIERSKKFVNRAEETKPGKFFKKHMTGGGPAGLAGGIAGGFIGEEAGNYAAIRHNVVNKDKQGK